MDRRARRLGVIFIAASALASISCSLLRNYDDIVGDPNAIGDSAPPDDVVHPPANDAPAEGGEDAGPLFCDTAAAARGALFCDDFDHGDSLIDTGGRWTDKSQLGGTLSIGPDGVSRPSSLVVHVDGAPANVARLSKSIAQAGEVDLAFDLLIETWTAQRVTVASIRLGVNPPLGYAEIGFAIEAGKFLVTKRIVDSAGTQPPSETIVGPLPATFVLNSWLHLRFQSFLKDTIQRRGTLTIAGATYIISFEPAFAIAPSQIRVGIHERTAASAALSMRIDNVVLFVR